MFLACGGSVGLDEIFTSPNYPANYNNNADCTWTIDLGYPVILKFIDADVESHSSCNYDSITVSESYLSNFV